jgi:peptidoglycan/xylan/chitin deacetylase (PgdA/CDA1 family)
MYHDIAATPPREPFPGLFTPPAEFAAEMAYLARHGYHVVTLGRVVAAWHGKAMLPPRPLVVSFDDGFRSWVTRALPTLRRFGWRGTVNLALSHLGKDGVSVRGIDRLLDAGWELDSHTLTHPDLTTLNTTSLRREVEGSRWRLQALFHEPVDFFCYPFGRYDAAVIRAVRRAGYRGATTSAFGLAAPGRPFTLDRIEILGADGVRGLAAKLQDALRHRARAPGPHAPA